MDKTTMNKNLRRGLLAVLFADGIVLAFLFRDQLDVATLEAWVARAGPAAPLLSMVLYGVATVLFLPGSVLTLAGDALFGPVWGTPYNLTGGAPRLRARLPYRALPRLRLDTIENPNVR